MARRELPFFGAHIFVFARPIAGDWSDYDHCFRVQGRDEFRPCMIRGHHEGQRVYTLGSQYGHLPEEFEFGSDIAVP